MGDRTRTILNTLRSRRARGEQVAMTQIIAKEQLELREQKLRKPKLSLPTTVNETNKPAVSMKRKANETDSSVSKKARTTGKIPKLQKNPFEKLIQEMTETMTRVTLTNTTTTNTTTISSSASSSHLMIDLTVPPSSLSVPSTLPLQSTSTIPKEKKTKLKKIHTYDDYLIYILKWPVSLIDELEPESGILYKDFLGDDTYPVPLLELYSSFNEYEDITLPWLFEETFEEVNKKKAILLAHIFFFK